MIDDDYTVDDSLKTVSHPAGMPGTVARLRPEYPAGLAGIGSATRLSA